jgi:hypothetical protein
MVLIDHFEIEDCDFDVFYECIYATRYIYTGRDHLTMVILTMDFQINMKKNLKNEKTL